MNILQLSLSFEPGGRRTAIVNLCQYLLENKCKIHIGCLRKPEFLDITKRLISKNKTTKISGALFIGSKGALEIRSAKVLANYCKANNVDIIHCHDAASQWLAVKSRIYRRNAKVIMTFHRTLNMESESMRDSLRNALAGVFTNKIVACSRNRLNFLRKHYFLSKTKTCMVHLGIDLNEFSPRKYQATDYDCDSTFEHNIDKNKFIICSIGHFGDEKGIDRCIETYIGLSRDLLDNTLLVIVGSGTSEKVQNLSKLATTNEFANIRFLGYQSQVSRLLPYFDLFLHLPRNEAFGLVLVEAMGCGVPIIACNTGGIPEIVNEEVGYVLDEPELINKARKAINEIFYNKALKNKLAIQARQRAENEFSIEISGERYMSIYKSV